MDNMNIQFSRDVTPVPNVQPPPEIKASGREVKNSSAQERHEGEKPKSSREPVNVEELVEKVTRHVESFSTKVSFSYDRERHQAFIVVSDKETGKIIRLIPPQEMLVLMDKMDEIAGIIFNGRA